MNNAVNFESLSRNAMQLSAQIIIDTADLSFLLWPDGQIAEATLGRRTRLGIDPDGLKNRDIVEIVQPEDAAHMTNLVAQARDGQHPRPVKLRHSPLIQDGTVARYSAHIAGNGKNIMLIGSALSAELSLSAQAARAEIARHQRHDQQATEDRYRLLFETSTEGLLVVSQASGLIEQSNGSASILIGQSPENLVGTPLWSHFIEETDETPSVNNDRAETLELSARCSASGNLVRVSIHTVRSLLGQMHIVRLNQVRPALQGHNDAYSARAIDLMRQISVPLVLIEPSGTVSWCNGAFAALIDDPRIYGRPIADVLSVSSHALDLTLRQADLHGRIPTSLTSLDSRLAIAEDAHLNIVAIPDAPGSYGILVHLIDDVNAEATVGEPETSALTDLVGKAPMKTLVRKSTSSIERSCIEAALRLTGNNRATAASVLGLSRQSLYLKMREHKLR